MPETGPSVLDAPQIVDEQAQQQAANKAELDRMMNINLNGGIEPAAQVEAPAVEESPLVEVPIPVTFESLKEKFGYENPESAIKEIEELRQLKTKPPATPEYEFENEESKKLFLALTKGDKKEAYKILSQQERLENLISAEVTKDTADEIIKMGMQVKYKDLTPSEIDYKFKKQFAIPKAPVQGDELDEEFAVRKSEWQEQVADIEMNKIIEAKLARPELELAKTKIVYPEIEDTVDEGYVQYKKDLEEQPLIAEAMKEIFKPFTPKSLETKIPFADETNKIGFEYQYEPDVESFTRSKEMAMDSGKFMDNFKMSDGKFDNLKYLRAIDLALNGDKYIIQAMTQAKNATIKAFIPDNSGGTQRQFPQSQQVNEVDEGMRLAGIKRA